VSIFNRAVMPFLDVCEKVRIYTDIILFIDLLLLIIYTDIMVCVVVVGD